MLGCQNCVVSKATQTWTWVSHCWVDSKDARQTAQHEVTPALNNGFLTATYDRAGAGAAVYADAAGGADRLGQAWHRCDSAMSTRVLKGFGKFNMTTQNQSFLPQWVADTTLICAHFTVAEWLHSLCLGDLDTWAQQRA